MIALVFFALASLALVRRLFAGVPQPARPLTVLSRPEAAFLEAAAAALLPDIESGLARPGPRAEVTLSAERHLAMLPRDQRRQVRAMFWFFEHATLLFPARGLRGFSRFSSLTLEQRQHLLAGWASSRLSARRSLLTALRAYVVMAAIGHPDNLRGLGLEPWTIDSPTIEADVLYPRVGEPTREIALGEDDLDVVRDVTPLAGTEAGSPGGPQAEPQDRS